jgi:Skp family chaperone for outer membrane proteins
MQFPSKGKKSVRSFSRTLSAIAFAVVILPLLAPSPGLSQSTAPPAPVILVIDMQRILDASTAVKEVERQIQERRNAYQQELRQREDELRAADQEISRQRPLLSSQEYARKRRELEERFAQFMRELSDQRNLLDDAFNKAMRAVERQLLTIADQIAAERAANLVIPKTAVVLVHENFEITDEALRRLNAEMPEYVVPPVQAD